jgi:predicted nucleotidyltransferase component of viral defense system
MELVGLRPAIIEKVDRISDILVRVGEDPLLQETLCLYGGTALNFLHFPGIPRLSEDLDFNYRHTSERDWGDVRTEVDGHIKGILHGLGYGDDQFRIQPKYNIGRFHVKYTNREGVRDSLKIEVGYTRRMPILREDASLEFHHPIHESSVSIRTPSREEIFANKFCTMLARKGPGMYLRDVFDVAMISQVEVDLSLMVDVVLVESLMCELDPSKMQLRPLAMEQMDALRPLVSYRVDPEDIRDKASNLYVRIIELGQGRGWRDFSERFWTSGSISFDHFANPQEIHPDIEDHPLLRWIQEKRKKRNL